MESTEKVAGPATGPAHHHDTQSHDQATACTDLAIGKRRSDAARRLLALECGCSDPWLCHCHEPECVRGYAEAAAHLLGAGLTPAPNLPAMRQMWRRGGEPQRLAQAISQRWGAA